MFESNNIYAMTIGLASPDRIREWSRGEVTKSETLNYRTNKPEPDGLFCEKIFGPSKDWSCYCGHYKKGRHRGVICEKCGVEVTESKVTRERMGHIELGVPVAHIWYYKGTTSRISIITEKSSKEIEQILNYTKHLVTYVDPSIGITKIQPGDIIPNDMYQQIIRANDDEEVIKVLEGGRALKKILSDIDLDAEAKKLKEEIPFMKTQRRNKAMKRLELLEAFKASGSRPEWMLLEALPVLPCGLRPLVELDGTKRATSDLNELYRKIIINNTRLGKLNDINAPKVLFHNQARQLQESVDALISNEKRKKPFVAVTSSKTLKSLTAALKGKQGRFRQNLLGKRVDYSGRSVIVVGPTLNMHECGLPKEMAKELFKPFIRYELEKKGIKGLTAREKIDRGDSDVFDVLYEIMKDHPVLLNRAPTLHRLGIQAFQPILVEGNAIQLHPLVCTAFNADFDGDQMAVHVPLSLEAQAEARFLMLATNNILKLSDGSSVVSPTQDMLLGSYYMTYHNKKEMEAAKAAFAKREPYFEVDTKNGTEKIQFKVFASFDEAMIAYQMKNIKLQDIIIARNTKEIDGQVYSKKLVTTVGKIIFNSYIPQDLGFVPRTTIDEMLELEIQNPVNKKLLGDIVVKCYKKKGSTKTAEILDNIKKNGFKYSTLVALTANIYDMKEPLAKSKILEEANKKTLSLEQSYIRGRLTDEGRRRQVVEVWQKATDDCKQEVVNNKDERNDIWMMADSGARGNIGQIAQIVSMKGLVVSTSGIIELPIVSSFKEGLSVLEYFIASHSSRKTLSDTAIKTADSGYLTRKLVDVAHNVIVTEDDCGDKKGTVVEQIVIKGEVIAELIDRIKGRFTIDDIVNPKTGEVIVKADEMIDDDQAKAIVDAGIEKVKIRSVLTCRAKDGVCAKCYGRNMASMDIVHKGEAVGVIAAQSIGEPGTQLTMRTFHSGGVATDEDITQGLPRVNELLDKRKPKVPSILSEVDGTVRIPESDASGKKTRIIVVPTSGDESLIKEYELKGAIPCVNDGDIVKKGDSLTHGSKNLDDLLKLQTITGVQDYIMSEVLAIYKSAGVPVNPKHIEIIIKQMLKKVKVVASNDSSFLYGEVVDRNVFEEENEKLNRQDLQPAEGRRIVQGITKSALSNESFLSAASFQETSRILTDAAIHHKVDYFKGLKENVILGGKLIPAGTGLKEYANFTLASIKKVNSEVEATEETINLETVDFTQGAKE